MKRLWTWCRVTSDIKPSDRVFGCGKKETSSWSHRKLNSQNVSNTETRELELKVSMNPGTQGRIGKGSGKPLPVGN